MKRVFRAVQKRFRFLPIFPMEICAYPLKLIKAGGALIDNMHWLFVIGVAVGMADDKDGTSALAGLVSFLMMTREQQDDGGADGHHAGDDGHAALAAEEGQPVRQLGVLELVVAD